jgi:peptidoglycan biosynthesis protein MviN/MurJ (putative lipid II flippase)
MASPTATYVGFLLLTINSILAIYRSRGDATAVLFVLASYLTLIQLFYSLRRFEESAPGSDVRDRARVGVWLATTALTAMFSWRVAAVMPWPVAAGVWLAGGCTVAGGYYLLFFLHHRPRGEGDH